MQVIYGNLLIRRFLSELLLWINRVTHWIIWNDSFEPHEVITQTQDLWLMSSRTSVPHRNIQILLNEARQRQTQHIHRAWEVWRTEGVRGVRSIRPREDMCYSDFTTVTGLKLQSDVSSVTKWDCKNSDPKMTLQLLHIWFKIWFIMTIKHFKK